MILLTTTTTTPSLAHADIISFIGVLSTALISIYIYNQTSRKEIEKKRYFSLVFPLFNMLEPHLFREKDDEVFAKAVDLIDKHRDIAGNDLWAVYSDCEYVRTQRNFIKLCAVANHEMDRCCRILKLKPRSLSYRLQKSQYTKKHLLFIHIVFQCLFLLVASAVFLSVLVFLTLIASSLLYR